jgi:hypothetical protein
MALGLINMVTRTCCKLVLALVLPLVWVGDCLAIEPLQESACFFMLGTSDTDSEPVRVPDLSVLHPPADKPDFVVDLDPGVVLSGVVCRRNRPEVSANDYRVVSAGYSFYVASGEPGTKTEALIVLEQTDVGHRVRVITGKLSKRQGKALENILEKLNVRQFGREIQSNE